MTCVKQVLLLILVVGLVACDEPTRPTMIQQAPVPSLTIVSGDAQTGIAGSELAAAIVAQATDGTGTPIAGITVSFVVTQGGGKLYAGTGVTNSSGNVEDYWTLGPVAGAPQTVEVRAVDPTSGVKNSYGTFTAIAEVGPAAIIKLSAGDGQTAFTRALLPIKPAVLVTDALGNPVAGVSVTFAVAAGGGTITGSPATTDASGVAKITRWRLGRAPGTNRLTATKTGLTGSPVMFMARGKFGMTLVATGLSHSCGLDAANDVYCWGFNYYGQVGDGTGGATADRSAPVRLANTALLPSSLALGIHHSCALLPTGKAYCWGYNSYGSLGDGTNTDSRIPVAVLSTQIFTSITAGDESTCGLASTGAPWCWGRNSYGQAGNGTTDNSNVPYIVAGALTFKSIYQGFDHTCALTAGGIAYCWGYNADGELGDGTTTQRVTLVAVAGGLSFTSLELGAYHTCGLFADGKAYCWGLNTDGQVGNGNLTNALSPQLVRGGIAFTQLAAGYSHTCGITSSGIASCWGRNSEGQLGVGSTSSPLLVPTGVAGGRRFSAISAGTSLHTCAVPVGGGNPFCWGYNLHGQLGNGSTLLWALPVEVLTPPIP